MTCTHRYLDNPDGLLCTRTDPHETGHTYAGTSASYLGEGGNRKKEPDGE